MNSKTKNIITNTVGLLIVLVSGYSFFFMEDTIDFYTYVGLNVLGFTLFLFQAYETKNYLMKFLNKKTGK